MYDASQIPAIALIAALMLAFGYIHLRFRSTRTLLWILALGCAELHEVLVWMLSQAPASPLATVLPVIVHLSDPAIVVMHLVAECGLLLSSALFLASLSPLSFFIGRIRVLYVVPYIVPVLLYAVLYFCVSQHPTGLLFWLYCGLAYSAVAAGIAWGIVDGPIPTWLAVTIVVIAGAICVPFFFHGNVFWPLLMVQSSNMLMTALLVFFSYRRFSPGVVLAVIGFLAWSVPPILRMQGHSPVGLLALSLSRAGALGQIVVAMGLMLLVLEDEVEKNAAAQKRERRIRMELEVYAKQSLTARSIEEFDRESSLLCQIVTENSRFAAAALLARGGGGTYTLVGFAGMDGATAGALDALAHRLPPNCFQPSSPHDIKPESARPTDEANHIKAAANSTPLAVDQVSIELDLAPWLIPGDDLERLHLTRLSAIPMLGPGNVPEGALLLAGLRNPTEPVRADDLLPVEILTARLQAARSQAMMLGKLIESERFVGVGQLATNVAQQLNNPLTVILGYASLLEESTAADHERRGAEAIVVEARRMKGILERLSRFSRLSNEKFLSFSVVDLLTDIEQLHRTDLLRNSIEFRQNIAPSLPSIFGNAQQIRQALLHAMQYAMESVKRLGPSEEKSVRIEASASDGRVQILVGHSGHALRDTEHVFDSFSMGHSSSDTAGIGLSLCAAIVREHRGQITATNLHPSGAAILIDLPIS